MSDALEIGEAGHYELQLAINNREPLSAAAIGELLSSLSRDYRQQNRGRTLVVTRLDSGSLWVTLTDLVLTALPYVRDAVEVAKGGKAITDFGKGIREGLERLKALKTPVEKPSPGDPYRTIEAMVKIAAETKSNIRICSQLPDNSVFEVELVASEAVIIREARAAHGENESGLPSRLPKSKFEALGGAGGLADEVQQLPGPDAHRFIKTVVDLLRRSGNENLVQSLAKELYDRGYHDLANAVLMS